MYLGALIKFGYSPRRMQLCIYKYVHSTHTHQGKNLNVLPLQSNAYTCVVHVNLKPHPAELITVVHLQNIIKL